MAFSTRKRLLVDPVTGFAGRIDSTNQYLTLFKPETARGQRWAIGSFFVRNPDFVCVTCRDADDFEQIAGGLRDRAIALDYCTLLLDHEVRVETKKQIAVELEELFANRATFSHVADILLAAPLHRSADLSVAGIDWLGAKVGELFKALLIQRQ